MSVSFFVPGVPVAKGSATAFYNRKLGRAFVVQTNKTRQRPWVSIISLKAHEFFTEAIPDMPFSIKLYFSMPRPKAHFTKRGLRDGAPVFHRSTPDIDKLARAVLDALTSIVWKDDSQVAVMVTHKIYSDTPGVTIEVEPIAPVWVARQQQDRRPA